MSKLFQYPILVEPLSIPVPFFDLCYNLFQSTRKNSNYLEAKTSIGVFPQIPYGWNAAESQSVRKIKDSSYLMLGGVINPTQPVPPPPTGGSDNLLPLIGVQ